MGNLEQEDKKFVDIEDHGYYDKLSTRVNDQ